MRLTEILKRDRERMKELPDRSSRLTFLWDYYKLPILVLLLVFLIAVISLFSSLSRSKVSLNVVLLNNDALIVKCDDTVFDRLLEEADYETNGKTYVNDRLSLGMSGDESADADTMQILSAQFMLGDFDLYAADPYYFEYFAKEGAFLSLTSFVEEETLKAHADILYQQEDSQGNLVPCGIRLYAGSPLHEAGYYHNEAILGVTANGSHPEAAEAILKTLFQ